MSTLLDIRGQSGPTGTLYAFEVAFEEGFGLAAWILIAGALASRLVLELLLGASNDARARSSED